MNQIVSFKKEIVFKTMISKITSISLEHTLALESNKNITGDFIVSGSYKMTEASQIDEKFSYRIPIEIAIDDKYSTTNITFDIDDFVYEVVDEEKLSMNIDLCIDNLELKEEKEYAENINILEDNPEKVDTLEEFDDVLRDIEELTEEQEANREVEYAEEFFNDLDEVSDDDLFLETSKEVELEIPEQEIDVSTKEMTLKSGRTDVETLPSEVNIRDEDASENHDVVSIFSAFAGTEETFSTYSIYIIREGDSIDTVLEKYKVTRDILKDYNDLSNIKIGSKIIIPSFVNE